MLVCAVVVVAAAVAVAVDAAAVTSDVVFELSVTIGLLASRSRSRQVSIKACDTISIFCGRS